MKKVILLTGCINPNGMSFTQLNNPCERQKQYIDAIHFYLSKTTCKIVFCENSNTDIKPYIKNAQDRLEILTFSGNQNKQRGKGYGEAEIIEYALHHSTFIQDNIIIIKITGRLIVNNILQLLKSIRYKHDFVTCLFHSDLKFADSRIFCGTISFFKELLKNKNKMDDEQGVFFEHILASTVLDSSVCFLPFSEEPCITGFSGTTGKLYQASTPSIKKNILYRWYSWIQYKKVYQYSSHRNINILKKTTIHLHIIIYKLLSETIRLSFCHNAHIMEKYNQNH